MASPKVSFSQRFHLIMNSLCSQFRFLLISLAPSHEILGRHILHYSLSPMAHTSHTFPRYTTWKESEIDYKCVCPPLPSLFPSPSLSLLLPFPPLFPPPLPLLLPSPSLPSSSPPPPLPPPPSPPSPLPSQYVLVLLLVVILEIVTGILVFVFRSHLVSWQNLI